MAEASLRSEEGLASLYLFDGGSGFSDRFGGSRLLPFAVFCVEQGSGAEEYRADLSGA